MMSDNQISKNAAKIRRNLDFLITFVCLLLVFYLLPKKIWEQAGLGITSSSWPQTIGIIMESKSMLAPDGTHLLEPEISFEYEVDGIEYQGSQVRFHPIRLGKHEMDQFIEKYPVGSEIPVFYKPGNPTVAVLIPGKELGHFIEETIAFLVGIAAFLTILFFIIKDIKKMNLVLKNGAS